AYSRQAEIYDTTIGWRFINPKLSALHHPYSMGETAENVAERYNITREEQDHFAFHSQEKYEKAAEKNIFKEEIIPYTISKGKGQELVFDKDEHPRLSPIDKLATLKPAFKQGGTVTAGNASGVNDGAAALILASESA